MFNGRPCRQCIFVLVFLVAGFFPVPDASGKNFGEKRYRFRIINSYPHDANAFTQGLIFHDGALYEGTGLYGRSSLRKVALATGQVEQIHHLGAGFFGEGIAICQGRLYQLTWQSRIGFIYEPRTFRKIGSFAYDTEGWGLTCDGRQLIMSDGTNLLRFLDLKTMGVVRTLAVKAEGGPLANLNELEYVKGEIYANIWNADLIARISPRSGRVLGWIDLSGLRAMLGNSGRPEALNGIAYDEKGDRLFVTGKLWPKIFQIELVPAWKEE